MGSVMERGEFRLEASLGENGILCAFIGRKGA